MLGQVSSGYVMLGNGSSGQVISF